MLKRFYQDGELTLSKAMLEAAAWISGVILAVILLSCCQGQRSFGAWHPYRLDLRGAHL